MKFDHFENFGFKNESEHKYIKDLIYGEFISKQ